MQKIISAEKTHTLDDKHYVKWKEFKDMKKEDFINLVVEKKTLYILSESIPPIKISLAEIQ